MLPESLNSRPLRWHGILSKDSEFASKEQIGDGSETGTRSSKLRPTGFQTALTRPRPPILPRISLNPALYTGSPGFLFKMTLAPFDVAEKVPTQRSSPLSAVKIIVSSSPGIARTDFSTDTFGGFAGGDSSIRTISRSFSL